MMGPSTFDGGYSSPSQVISSAMERAVGAERVAAGMVFGVNATARVCWETGAKAEAVTARMAKRSTESLDIFLILTNENDKKMVLACCLSTVISDKSQ